MGLYRSGGGGQMTETTLWTNSSTASDFTSQTVTLTDAISNYDYIKFTIKAHKTSSDKSISIIISVSDLAKTSESSYPRLTPGIVGKNTSSSASAVRGINYVSDTQIKIGNNSYLGQSGNANAYVIPLKISGLKY